MANLSMNEPSKIGLAAFLLMVLCLSHHAHAQQSTAAPTVNLASDESDPALASDTSDAASDSATALAKKLQNPIGNLYSIPFQSNTNFGYGPNKGTQEILNIQPVIPTHLDDNWNLITRVILPLIWQPSLAPAHTVPFGIGPTSFSAFISPSQRRNGIVWGAGPIFQLPTITSKTLGSSVWGVGPTGVVVYMTGPIVAGALSNNVWSLGGTSGKNGTRYDNFLLQPFANYNFGGGWYVGTAPIITANWLARGNNAWTLPLGGYAARVIKIGGKLPINLQAGAYANVLRPRYGATWQFRTQATFIF